MKTSAFLALTLGLTVSNALALEVGDISHGQVDMLERRIETRNFVFAGFGPSALLHLQSEGMSYHLRTGIQREAHPNAAIRGITTLDFRPQDNAWMGDVGLGAVFYVLRSDFSPYVGGDFGYGVAYGGDWSNGFSLGGSVGMQLFRTATTQMNLEGRATTIFDENVGGNPVSLSANLGIFF